MEEETRKILETMKNITNNILLMNTNLKLLTKRTDEFDKRIKFLEGVEEEEREVEENEEEDEEEEEEE